MPRTILSSFEVTMKPFPLPLPPSLASYHEFFFREPEECLRRLEMQIKRRGYDAVGCLLMSWLYLQRGDENKGFEYARLAKAAGPGSRMMDFAPYLVQHEKAFDAWLPEQAYAGELSAFFVDRTLNLDDLIEKLSLAESTRITLNDPVSPALPGGSSSDIGSTPKGPSTTNDNASPEPASDEVNLIDEIYTETMARIFELQGNYAKAIDILERLKLKDPERASYFQEKIDQLASKR